MQRCCSRRCAVDYRMATGAGTRSAECRQKISATLKSKPVRYWLGKGAELKRKVPGIGKWMRGRKASFESRAKRSAAWKGCRNPNWQGGKTTANQQIRGSLEYRRWREAVFLRDDFTCQLCLIRGGRLEADHIKPFSKFPEVRLDVDNGRTLCVECHKKTPSYLNRHYASNQ
jgi:5-methylcytosine-specific restriction endonuclease McrA